MTAVDDLATWLTQIWDEREQAAKREAEYAEGYHADKVIEYQSVRFVRDTPGGMVWGTQFGPGAPSPAEVLARIAADRKILALHQPVDEYELVCSTCATREVAAELSADLYPCATARLLALPHADRPGYQEAWMPA